MPVRSQRHNPVKTQCCPNGEHTQRFTRDTRKALGKAGTERKISHSLRHEFAQQLDWNQGPEDRLAPNMPGVMVIFTCIKKNRKAGNISIPDAEYVVSHR